MRLFLLALVSIVVIAFSSYEVVSAVHTSQTTGLLLAKSSAGATLSVVKPNYQLVNIGVGSARVRLAAGTYQLIATKDRNQSTTQLVISRRQTTTVSLQPVSAKAASQANRTALANKLIQQLPYQDAASTYNISFYYQFGQTTSQPIILITTPTTQGRQAALAWITSKGYDPSQLSIEYVTATVLPINNPTYSPSPTPGE